MPRHPARAALLAAALLALAACDVLEPSENVNQDRIWTEYELHYDGGADVTSARATFRFGGATGTLLELSDPSRVLANGEALTRRTQPLTNVTFYERDFAGAQRDAAFDFVDTDGTSYRNAISLRGVATPLSIGPIDNDASFEVAWVGEPLAANEEVGAVLYRVVGGGALAVFTRRDVGARTIILDRAQLQNVSAGEATLVLERRVTGTLAQRTEVGGRIVGRWTAAPVRVEVRD